MTGIKNILARIFAFWALLIFATTMLITLIPIFFIGFLKEPRRSVLSQKVFATWLQLFFLLSGVRRIVKGKEQFKAGENYVIVCNHTSFMDPPLTSSAIPGTSKTIAKIEMAKIPLFGVIYRRGAVLVDRKSERSRAESFIRMKDVLKQGFHMCIYPEGTRNKTSEPMQPFHDGAFRLAINAKKPIMPAVLFYTSKVLPTSKKFYFWPHRIEMHYLPPHYPAGKTVQSLKDEVYEEMKKFYVSHLAQ